MSAWDALLGDFDENAQTIKLDTSVQNKLKESLVGLGSSSASVASVAVPVAAPPPTQDAATKREARKSSKIIIDDEDMDEFMSMDDDNDDGPSVGPPSAASNPQHTRPHETDTMKLVVTKGQFKAPLAKPKVEDDDFDFDLAEMQNLSQHAEQARKPLKLSDGPVTPVQQTKAAEQVQEKKFLSNNQVDDLESFLNDDFTDSHNSPKVTKTTFGSFLSPNADLVKTKTATTPSQQRKQSKLNSSKSIRLSDMPTRKYLDFSHGLELPVKNWGLLLIHNAAMLENVSFANNNLPELPIELADTRNVTVLEVHFNRLAKIPETLRMNQLRVFNAANNMLTGIPSTLSKVFPELQELILHKNLISTIDPLVANLQNLSSLDLSSNKLTAFPVCILQLAQLKYLDLSGNQIEDVTENLSSLTSLQKFIFSNNQLTRLTKSLLETTAETLDFSNNKISKLASNFTVTVANLKLLYLEKNHIVNVPANFSNFIKLELLDLRNNPLKTISACRRIIKRILTLALGKLTTLKALLLTLADPSSQLAFPPLKVCQNGLNAILLYMRDVLKGTADPESSFAFGSGLASNAVVCSKEHFLIKAVDKYGLQKTKGDDVFDVTVERSVPAGAPEVFKVTPIDKNDGSYYVEYDATRAGTYSIHVLSDGTHIKNSPFRVEMESGPIYSQKCKWKPVSPDTPSAGDETCFKLTLKDEYGNDVKTSGHQVLIKVYPTNSSYSTTFKYKVEEADPGTYLAKIVQNKSGIYYVNISVDGEDISPSSIEMAVKPGPVSPGSCTMSATGTRVAEMNVRTSFVIQSRDKYGNIRNNLRDVFTAKLTGQDSREIKADMSENSEVGEYYASYSLPSKGKYRVEVKAVVDNADVHIAGSPFELFVSDNREAQMLQIQQENVRLANALAEANKKHQELVERLNSKSKEAPVKKAEPKFECERGMEETFCTHMVTNYGPQRIFVQPVPAYIFAKVLEQAATRNQSNEVQQFISSFLKTIISKTSGEDVDPEVLPYWLSNLLYLRQSLVITPNRQLKEALGENETALAEITAVCENTYRQIIKSIQNWLSPIVVGTFLEEHNSATKHSYLKSFTRKNPGNKKAMALDSVVSILATTQAHLQKFNISESIASQLFQQVFRFIDALLFNSLLLRKQLCDSETAKIMSTNLSPFEEWLNQNFNMDKTPVPHLFEAIQLLKLPIHHMTSDDVGSLLKVCVHLNGYQVEKLLRNSSEKISSEVINAIIVKINARDFGKVKSDKVQVFLDTFFIDNLEFPVETAIDPVFVPRSISIPGVQRLE